MSLTDSFRNYDAWVTREPDYPEEPPMLRCSSCGAYLKRAPERSEDWEDTEYCAGTCPEVVDHYTEADASILDIIGWDKLGQQFTTAYDAACGKDQPHEHHEFVVAGGIEEYRTCARCGHENLEVIC